VWHHKKELKLHHLECTWDSGHWTMDWTLDSIIIGHDNELDFRFWLMARGQTSHAEF